MTWHKKKSTSLSHAGNLGHLTRIRHSSCRSGVTDSSQCVQYCQVSDSAVWLPVFDIFNVHTDADACDCTWGAVRTLSALKVDSGRQIPLLHQGVNSVLLLALCLSFRSDAVPAELSCPLCLSYQSDALPTGLSHLLCLSFRSDALPTEMSHPLCLSFRSDTTN